VGRVTAGDLGQGAGRDREQAAGAAGGLRPRRADVLTSAFAATASSCGRSWVDVIAALDAAQEAEAALAAGDYGDAKAAAALAESLARKRFLPGEDGAWVEEKRRELADVRTRAMNRSR